MTSRRNDTLTCLITRYAQCPMHSLLFISLPVSPCLSVIFQVHNIHLHAHSLLTVFLRCNS